MAISESTIQAICDFMRPNEEATCEAVAHAVNKARVTAREALGIMVKRGLLTKKKSKCKRFGGISFIYTRTETPYYSPQNKVSAYDFTELLAAWRVRAANAWSGVSHIHECSDDQKGFGEFADGTCL